MKGREKVFSYFADGVKFVISRTKFLVQRWVEILKVLFKELFGGSTSNLIRE